MHIIECGNCNQYFSRKDAICEDWRNPEKRLICPKCETPLKDFNIKNLLTNKQYWLTVAPGVLIAPCFIGLAVGLSQHLSLRDLLIVLGILAIPITLLFVWFRKFIKPLRLLPY